MTKTPHANIIRDVATQYLQNMPRPATPLTSQQRCAITDDLMIMTADTLNAANQTLDKGARYRIPDDLLPDQVAQLILHFEPVVNIIMSPNSKSQKHVGVYLHDGPNAGTYSIETSDIELLIHDYSATMSAYDCKEVIRRLGNMAPMKHRTTNPDFVPVANGVFDYKTKRLLPFSPDYVFLSKCRVAYNHAAQNVIIHNPDDGTDWDVESWVASLSDDPEVADLLWEVIGASVRPYVPWGKSVWFYSTHGNNGKGTLCSLMRNLIGETACAAIPLLDFGRNFCLGDLVTATACINDENDVGELVSHMGALKSAITNDVFRIENKFKDPFAFRFYGLMVQCFNEYPFIRDRSGSLYRRILLVPFEKCFTGAERKYIKSDYLTRQDVLEYVLFKVLNTNYYQLSEPDACKMLMDEFQTNSNPIKAFLDEILEQTVWDLLPFTFLYDLYRAWLIKYAPQSKAVGRNRFIRELEDLIKTSYPDWELPSKNPKGTYNPIPRGNKMDEPEHMIYEYHLTEWSNKRYKGDNIDNICRPCLKDRYRGIERKPGVPSGPAPAETGED